MESPALTVGCGSFALLLEEQRLGAAAAAAGWTEGEIILLPAH